MKEIILGALAVLLLVLDPSGLVAVLLLSAAIRAAADQITEALNTKESEQ